MDPCKDRQPSVINHSMISRCLEEQGLKGEMGRLAREEGITWDEVQRIRLEFMNILRIDHLWVLPALTELSLSNNLLEKIERLHMLVHLKHLDLSFNKIRKIENLNTLTKLEVLNLSKNLIDTIENIENLKELIIFSIGSNNITKTDNVLYLRILKNLKSVNMSGNPIAREDTFRVYIATFLPQIVYYEYKLIDANERKTGEQLYAFELKEVQEAESITICMEERLEAERIEAEQHSESFIEFLNSPHLFNQMFDRDVDGKIFSRINSEAQEHYNEFKTQILQLCKNIFENGQEQYEVRKNEVTAFTNGTDSAKYDNQLESIKYMEEFRSVKTSLLERIDKEKSAYWEKAISYQDYFVHVAKFRKEFDDKVRFTWKTLMSIEVTLNEQLEEINDLFEQSLTEMVNNFVEMSQNFFAMMRSAESSYAEQITDLLNRLHTTLTISPQFPVIPLEAEDYFEDKANLLNGVAASHDVHVLSIDNREERLVRRARAWLSNLVNDLQKDEIQRNRSKILEINHYLDIQSEEFENYMKLEEMTIEL